MKKGKKVMQIPIQSLNSKHNKKFNFNFNEDVYQYSLEENDFTNIDLVLSDGNTFLFEVG